MFGLAHRISNYNEWMWQDSSLINYFNCGPGQPNFHIIGHQYRLKINHYYSKDIELIEKLEI